MQLYNVSEIAQDGNGKVVERYLYEYEERNYADFFTHEKAPQNGHIVTLTEGAGRYLCRLLQDEAEVKVAEHGSYCRIYSLVPVWTAPKFDNEEVR